MLKRFSTLLVLAASSALLAAQGSTIQLKVNKTPVDNGKQMYVNYCAPCHGVDGRGNGPVAKALKVAPADLTVLAQNNHGVYPAVHLLSVVKFGVQNPAHGSAEMPIWGSVFRQMDTMNTNAQTLRISNLVEYLKTLQAK